MSTSAPGWRTAASAVNQALAPASTSRRHELIEEIERFVDSFERVILERAGSIVPSYRRLLKPADVSLLPYAGYAGIVN